MLCLSSYCYGYYDPAIDYDTLLPVQLLTAVFFGILFGFGIFMGTRTFYNSSDVVKAIHTAHKTQSGRLRKLKESHKKIDKGGRPKLPAKGKRGHRVS